MLGLSGNAMDGEWATWLLLFGRNIAAGLAAIALYGLIRGTALRFSARTEGLLLGLLFGMAGVIAMRLPVAVAAGVIVDGRNIFVLIGTLFGGPLGGAAALLLPVAYRISVGGTGMWASVASALIVAGIGAGVAWRYRERVREFGPRGLLAVGAVAGLAPTLVARLLYLGQGGRHGWPLAAELAQFISFPLAVLVIGNAVTSIQYRRWRESEERLRNLVDNAAGVLLRLRIVNNERGQAEYVGGPTMELLGYTADEMLAAPDLATLIMNPEDRLTVLPSVAEQFKTYGKAQSTWRVNRRDGAIQWVANRSRVVSRPGETLVYESLLVDVTEQMETTEALRREQAKLARIVAALDMAPDGIAMIDAERRVLYANQAARQVAGIGPEVPMVGRLWGEALGEGSGPTGPLTFDRIREAAISSGEAVYHELPWRRPGDGEVRQIANWYRMLPDGGAVTVLRDVTEARRDEERHAEAEAELRLHQTRLEALVDNSAGMTYRMRLDRKTGVRKGEYINKAITPLLGYSVEEYLAAEDGYAMLVHPEEAPAVAREAASRLFATGQNEGVWRARTKSGEARWIQSRARMVEEHEDYAIVEGLGVDVTAQVENEIALRARERELQARDAALQTLIDNSAGVMYRLRAQANGQRKAEFISRGIEDIFGYSVEELLAADDVFGLIIHPDQSQASILAETSRLFDQGRNEMTWRGRTKTGESRWIQTRGRVVGRDGEASLVEGFLIDATERVENELALRARDQELLSSRAHLQTLIDNSAGVMYRLRIARDGRQKAVFVSRSIADLLGYSVEELLAADDVLDLIAAFPEIREPRERGISDLFDVGYAESTWRARTKSGEIRWVMARARRVALEEDGTAIVEGLLIDVSAQVETLEALRDRDAKLERILAALDLAGDGITVTDKDRRVLFANQAILDGAGIVSHDLLGRAWHEVVGDQGIYADQALVAEIEALRPEDGTVTREVSWPTPDGADRRVVIRYRRLPDGGSIGVTRDVTNQRQRETEQRRLERQLEQSRKTEALGQLAGGIAHDFNNLLGAMLGFAHFIAEDSPADGPIHRDAQRILTAGRRAKALTAQILSFARRRDPERRLFHLDGLVEETLGLLGATLPATTTLRSLHATRRTSVVADRDQLSQVLINLCVNANDALGGEIGAITVELVEPDETILARLASGGSDGVVREPDEAISLAIGQIDPAFPHLSLKVTDTGAGMDEAQLERIFDPFFTTKGPGRGTGLGLSVVHGIVLAHGGGLVVRTRPGRGTTIELCLACSPDQPRSEPVAEEADIEGETGRTALLVDDNLDFLDMMTRLLERLGFEVAACTSPEDAILYVEQQPMAWDLLVTDQTMPGMKGIDLVREIKIRRPDLPCIVCTGFSSSISPETALAAGADAFLTKPVDMDGFGRLVEDLLRRR